MRLGPRAAARSVSGVCAILIGADNDELVADLAARFPEAELVANEAVVHDDLAKVIRFVDKPTEGLDLPLDMRGTPFQRRVWEKLRAIPVGRTVSYTRARPLDQPPGVAPCGRGCLRCQSDRAGRSLPSRRAAQWRLDGLPLGHRAQA